MTKVIAEAIAVADELDQIRSVFGDECVGFVKRALMVNCETDDWRDVVDGAMSNWTRHHPQTSFDSIL
jgi:hypothetical protein